MLPAGGLREVQNKMKIISRKGLWWFCAALAGLAPLCAGAAPPAHVPAIIQRNYDAARRQYDSNPGDDQAAWQFGRACFDRAEFPRDDAERASLAQEGIAACRKVVARRPNLAAGHYYLGLNLAQLARTKLLGALPLVGEMEQEWMNAISLDEKMDYAGPDRYVGLLYRDAPRWPVSVGDAHKARRHLARAVELSPDFPENHLNLIESHLGWTEYDEAARAAEKLRALRPAARKEFVGEYWEESWKDWDQRLADIQVRLNSHPKK
jgi:tetratricopeptide (TPR) repeat protein